MTAMIALSFAAPAVGSVGIVTEKPEPRTGFFFFTPFLASRSRPGNQKQPDQEELAYSIGENLSPIHSSDNVLEFVFIAS